MMNSNAYVLGLAPWLALLSLLTLSGCATLDGIEPNTRPQLLVQQLENSPLKEALQSCDTSPFAATPFSISHRGAPLGYPEHTAEGYQAAAAMGAGVIECDVTFTRDNQLVCRHSQCDLHSTTNILQTPLAITCRVPFKGADGDEPASAQCCTSDITQAEFLTLCGRPDRVDPQATTVEGYLSPATATPAGLEGLKAPACGTLLTHQASIELIDKLGADFTPELKSPMVDMPHRGMSQQAYADKLIRDYEQAGIDPGRVYPQSFNPSDVAWWIQSHPAFADQAVYLDPRGFRPDFQPTLAGMQALFDQGFRILAPPIPVLLEVEQGALVATEYAKLARAAGLQLITWTFEAGVATDPNNRWHKPFQEIIKQEGDMLQVLQALDKQANVIGVFSDWPGTVTYYANCRKEN